MGKIRIIIKGAAGGVMCGIICFALILAMVTAFREGPGAGLAVLVVSPLYFFLYIIAFFNTLLPAGLITGIAAGLGEAYLPKRLSLSFASLSGIGSGFFFGIRFTEMFLESRNTKIDLIVGAITAGIFLAAGAVLICVILRRTTVKNNR